MLTVRNPPIPISLLQRTFNYEETLRAKRSPNIGFAAAAVAVTAAFLGYRRQAATLFRDAWVHDWIRPFGMIKEALSETYGCFLITCGSLLQRAMLGFTGLRVREVDWRAYVANLPEGWKQIEIGRFWIRGMPPALIAENGKLLRWVD